VRLQTREPGTVDGHVQVKLIGEEQRPTLIPVSGRVARAVEVQPSLLVLPRASANGFVFSATCLCRSTDGKPVDLAVTACSPGLSATVENGSEGQSVRTVQVSLDPAFHKDPDRPRDGTVELTARVGGQETVLVLPVEFR
jgi:hypothetical protein